MKSVSDYIEEGRIKKVSRDVGKAEGLLERSRKRLGSTESREVTDSSAFMVLENAYESIRECIESLMALEGFKSEDHVATIAWAASVCGLRERSSISYSEK